MSPTLKHHAKLAALFAGATLLSACELRRDGDPDEALPADAETLAEPTPTASETAETSIIREELVSEERREELVQPVELTLPFPDGTDISERAERTLANILQSAALRDEDWPVVIGGHTDSGGNDQANLRASRARAEAVAAWLVERGVDDDRIEVIAFGEQNPVRPNALTDGEPNEEGRRANRRVEISIRPPEETEPEAEATPRPRTSPAPKATQARDST
ncbi:MAG: OmpA family protein [Alteraurantiacibacter sp.]